MIVAGAGGHALELLDILIANGMTDNLVFFDEFTEAKFFQDKYPILSIDAEVAAYFKSDSQFILGTGNPMVRFSFYQRFLALGGKHRAIKGVGVVNSPSAKNIDSDIFNLCFIAANTQIGRGTLINTGAQIHHDVIIGEFAEITPRAVLLGASQVGDFSSIGANATILPEVKIGKRAIVGAGSVVTQDVPDGVTVVEVPGRIII
ncbi:acetyltransferase [Algoriphagus terrigena]|uniref:acetyltransferase n=1 Tax=Algoriphagus terrigena TaxID=344884 RepID=UPI000427E8C5|nr:acetyltransferase [Algoriphagus terrigena]